MKRIILVLLLTITINMAFAQNVGIGTNAPAYPLTLSKEGNGIVQKGTNVEIGTATSATAGIIRTYTNNALEFYTGANPATQLALTYNGRIGFVTNTPNVKMEIRHNSFDFLQFTNTNALASGQSISVTFKTGSSYTAAINSVGTSATTARLGFATGSFLTERLSITHDGKVGINETNPFYTLEVKGTTELTPAGSDNTSLIVNGVVRFANSAFRVTASPGNLNGDNFSITIDNPLCNNKPDVMLLVTSTKPRPIPFSVGYSNTLNKWIIFTTTEKAITGLVNTTYLDCNDDCKSFINPILGSYRFNEGDTFNVLVIED